MLAESLLAYVVATAPPNCSELVQVTRNLILANVPALNPGSMLPLNPIIEILGVKLSLEKIHNNIPLL